MAFYKNDVTCLFRLMAERTTDVTSVARLFRLMAERTTNINYMRSALVLYDLKND